jgi:hypothetical protein
MLAKPNWAERTVDGRACIAQQILNTQLGWNLCN